MKNTPQVVLCADKLAVLADATRLAVVELLLKGPRHVADLNREIRIAQSLLSHHLRILREAGVVVSRRDGKAVLYEVAPDVAKSQNRSALNLGCCSLKFERIEFRKK